MKYGYRVLFIVSLVSMTGVLRAAEEDSEEDAQKSSEVAAQYILRLENTIADEKLQLADLKQELTSRERAYQKVTRQAKALQAELEEKQTRIVELDMAEEPEQAEDLEQSVSQITRELKLVNEEMAFAFQLQKNIRDHIQTLETKLKKDIGALAMVKDGTAAQPTPEPTAPSPTKHRMPPAESPTGAPTGLPIPGMTLPASKPQQLLYDDQPRPETAAQIAARIEVDRQEKRAGNIAAFQVDFAKRKELLEHQIELEETGLANLKEAIANLEALLTLRQKTLAEETATDADGEILEQAQKEVRETEASLKRKKSESTSVTLASASFASSWTKYATKNA